MDQSSAEVGAGELGYCAWIGFWGQLIVLGLLAVVGAFFASAGRAPGDDVCGLTLSVAAIALAFLRLKARFDGASSGWGSFLLVDDMRNLAAVIVVFTALALAGLFVAAGTEYGGLHDAGVALFVACALAILLSLKHVFDAIDRRS